MDDLAHKTERCKSLLQRHRQHIQALCMRRARGDAQRCAELLQEVCLGLWKNVDGLIPLPPDSWQESLWLRRQVKHLLSNLGRQRRPYVLCSEERLMQLLDKQAIVDEDESLLDLMTEGLTDDEQALLDLLRQGYTTAEAAARLGLGVEAAKSRRRRLIEKMRQSAAELNMIDYGKEKH